MSTTIVARRKGTKVRMFDRHTAKMGPWVTDPKAERERTMLRMLERQGLERAQFVEGYVTNAMRGTRPILLETAKVRGIQVPLRATKAVIANLLADAAYEREIRKVEGGE